MMSWDGMSKGSFLIFGHIHNNTNDTYWPLLKTMTNALNASVDINGFMPVTFDELVENNERFQKEN
jgi:calcineurin-like phosphoesterase family protein